VYLIDTPGLDDSHKDNVKVLQEIASYLCTFYASDFLRIVGIIYFHRISDPRMAGSSLTSLRIFEKLCGPSCFPRITIVTSFWSFLQDGQMSIGEDREKTLGSEDTFFGTLIKGGAKMKRYEDSHASACSIIEGFFDNGITVVLDIQKEMIDGRKSLAETSVGEYLEGDLLAVREKYERALLQLGREYDEAIAEEQDDDVVTTIAEERKAYEERIELSELTQRSLFITFEDMERQQQDRLREMQDDYPRVTVSSERSAREIELEEQLERMEMDHFRQLNIVRRDKEAELTDAYYQGYDASRKVVLDNLKHERAEKESTQTKPRRQQTLLQLLSIAVAESVHFLQGLPRAASFPQETRTPKPLPKIDISNTRLTQWARRERSRERAKKSHGPSQSYKSHETSYLENYEPQDTEQAEDSDSEDSADYPSDSNTAGYHTIRRSPQTTRVFDQEEVIERGPKRRPHPAYHRKLARTYGPQETWR
jgi:hypothetical protein